ncbi:MAG TPA: cytochrome c peroxidase [Steroidobacteraceae bacterium]|nr:cytochrome c peroxidase [Steroidobacteraceae bacterium]
MGTADDTGTTPAAATLSAAAQLGQKIFSDKTLSVSGQQSCATCHVAQFAFASDPTPTGPDHGSPVPLGGANMDLPGFRNTPSLMYASYIPAFYYDSSGNPYGGFFRDGRAKTLAAQAALPFVTSFEMANTDAAAVIARLQTRPYLADFEALYGAAVLNDPATALQDMGAALAAFETEDPQFHPFSSKYDAFIAGKAQLSAQEQRGLADFNDPSKGNCAACHPSTSADGVTPPMFTDFSYDNLGLPRNSGIPANSDTAAPGYTPADGTDGVHGYYDIGICGPFRDNAGLNLFGICGQFKVPTLRNIAVTAPYFHNGQFATLSDTLGFYVRRDTNPEQFYPTDASGNVTKFDDLPAIYGGLFVANINVPGSDAGYVGNVNTLEIPYNRHIGDTPALSGDDINDVIAFLCTLTDGFDPQNPTAQVLPAQCQAAVSAASSASTSRTAGP